MQGSRAWRGRVWRVRSLQSEAWRVNARISKNDMQEKTCNHCDCYGLKLREERGLAFCRHHGKHFMKQRDRSLPPTDQRTCPHWKASENPIHVTLRNDFFNERLAIMIFCGNVPEDQAVDDVEVCWVKYFRLIKTGQQATLTF